MVVNIREAKSKLSELVERAVAGEAAREVGFARGMVRETPGWEKPLDDREIAEMFGTEV